MSRTSVVTAAEREGLAEVVMAASPGTPTLTALKIADALADLLAARDRRVRAEALRDAADETYEHTTIGQDNRRTVTLRPLLSTDVCQWLRDRADRIEADA